MSRFSILFGYTSSWTNKILAADDFAAVQINVANIDPVTGLYTKTSTPIGLCGYVRAQVLFSPATPESSWIDVCLLSHTTYILAL
jgi:hypothetical protein